MGERPYTLEVTSPGTDRPLTLPRHWRRNQGRLVKVACREGEGFTGRIVRAGDESAVVAVDGNEREVAFETIAKARVQIEFNRKER
jgi:ribosome maturation factor RimP